MSLINLFAYVICSIITTSVVLIAVSVFWDTFRVEVKYAKMERERKREKKEIENSE